MKQINQLQTRRTIILISMTIIITLFLMNNVSAYYSVYQENANNTDVINDSSSGYIYFNYTKLIFATNQTKWQIRISNTIQNITLNNSCFEQNANLIELRFKSNTTGTTEYTYAECKNLTSWNQVATSSGSIVGISHSYSNSYSSRAYDGDWNTGADFNTGGIVSQLWRYANLYDANNTELWEEAIIWNISEENFIENSQTFNTITTESSNETFIINLQYNGIYYPVSSANLIYNGTTYSSTKTLLGINTIFTTNVVIPSIIGTQQNHSFYWNIALTNSTGTYYFNSSSNNQTVNAINLGECSGTTIYTALNITAFDEKTLNRINPFDLKGTLTYSTSPSSSQKNYSFTNLSISNKEICINANTTFYLNGLLEYSNTSYQTKNYYFLDYPISNNTNNLKLYMLPTASSTSFIIKVQDTNLLPLANYYVSIFRYNAGNETPYLVQTVKTDLSGSSVAFLEIETVDYLFEVFDTDGNMVFISDKQRAIPQETPYTITLTVGTDLPSPLIYLANLTGLTYSLSYDKSTFKITYTYSDTNTSFSSAGLNVYRINNSGSDILICTQSKTTSAGVIICDLTGNSTGSYYGTATVTRGSQIFIDRVTFEIDTFSQTAGMLGILGAFFIIMISAFLFAYNEIAGIIGINIAVIAVNLIGFVHFGGIFITAMISISILLLIILERG